MPPRDPVIPATPPGSDVSPQSNTSAAYPIKVSDLLATQNKSTISIVLTTSGDRNTFKFDSDDYNVETLRIAQGYAVGVTSDAKNKYGIDPQLTEGAILDSTLTDGNGNPVAISDNAPGSPPAGPVAFINRATPGTIGKSIFVNLSDSGQLDFNIIKGKAVATNSESKDYDVLLGEINRDNNVRNYGTENNNQLPASVIRMVSNQNSNSPDNVYVPDGQAIPEKNSNVGRIVLPIKLGSHSKIQPTLANGGSQTGNVSAEGNFLANQDLVQSLGSQVTLKSSGEYYVPKNAFNPDEVLLARTATLAPGRARLGIKVPFQEMRASTVLKQNNPDFADFDLPSLKEDEVLSYGSYNNWLNAFNNGNTIASIPGLAIQIGTLATVLVGIAALVKPNDEYLNNFKVGFVTFFGLPPLRDSDAITGSAAFAASVAQAILSNRLQKETGWYSTVLRSVNRIIVESTVGTGLTIAANAGDDAYGASAAGVQGAQNIIEQFYKGRLRGFINNLAIIGQNTRSYWNNAAIPEYKKGNETSTLNAFGPSYINSIDDSTSSKSNTTIEEIALSSLIKRNRLKSTYGLGNPINTMTTWGTSTTPSMYILPNNITLAAGAISNNGTAIAALATLKGIGAVDANTPRISQTTVEELEQKLNSSYMPFYFHDIRTNEIISFHALLEDSQDNFSADWNAQTPYGRVEPIHTYKGTTRDISLSFYVVATNPEDHDNMWWKINKLVTMLYPQYTTGRNVTAPDGKKFIQPFSQIPGNSPIIRLRLGDIWKSNYSKFNVARAFGLGAGQENFNIDQAQELTNEQQTWVNRYVSSQSQKIRSGKLEVGDRFIIRLPEVPRTSSQVSSAVFGEPGGAAAALNTDNPNQFFDSRYAGQGTLTLPAVTAGRYALLVEDILAGPQSQQLICEYKVKFVNPPAGVNRNAFVFRCPNPDVPSQVWDDFANQRAVREAGIVGVAIGGIETSFQTPDYQIAARVKATLASTPILVDDVWLRQRATDLAQQNTPSTASDSERQRINEAKERLWNFFGEQNPIMQAFESTAGKGMAIAFKSIQFDWKNSTWETDWNESKNSSRAPMMLKISMAGTVIHDITPGIDFAGLNVAPVYQVGSYSTVLSKVDARDSGRDASDSAGTGLDSDTSRSLEASFGTDPAPTNAQLLRG